jgi:DNA-binding LacI/PurR family transcriptional regulator
VSVSSRSRKSQTSGEPSWAALRSVSTSVRGELASPQLSYRVTKSLVERSERFTALSAFDYVSAIGAIDALRDAKLEVPGNCGWI